MRGFGHRITARAGLAMMLVLVLSAGVVMAAGPRPAPAPGSGSDEPPAAAALKLVGWAGSVRSADDEAALVRLVTVNGTFEVAVDDQTQLLRSSDGTPLAPGDLAAAMPLDVQGQVTNEARIAAAVITVGELPPTTASERLTLRGRVLAAFNPSSVTAARRLLVITTSRGESVLEVDGDTLIVDSEGQKLTFDDLRAGAAVLVEAFGTTQAVARARAIEVSTSGRAPQVTVDGILVARGSAPDDGERWIVGEVLLWVPEDLAKDNRTKVSVGTRVSVTAQRNQSGELEALQVRVPSASSPSAQVVELRGRVDRVDADMLVVDGNAIRLGVETASPPGLAVGMFVKIRARLDADGTLSADTIEVLTPGKVEVQFEGPIESLAADVWRVAGVTVRLDAETVLVGDPPTVGGHAEVSGTQLAKLEVRARRIKVAASVTPAWSAVEGFISDMPKPPAVWRVLNRNNQDETEVVVTDATIIDRTRGATAVGAWVQVEGARDKDNRVEAVRIKVLRPAR